MSTIAPDEEPGLHWPSYDEVVKVYDNLRRLKRDAAKARAAARGVEDLRVEVRELRESLATLVRLVRRIVEAKKPA